MIVRALVLWLVVTPALALDLRDYGALCDGKQDTVPAWNAAVAAAKWAPDRTIDIPAGACRFASPPAPLDFGIGVEGQGLANTTLRADYDGSFLEFRGSGTRILSLTVWKEAGRAWGWGIWCVATDVNECGNPVMQDVWITGRGTWYSPLHIDGASYRTAQPLGARAVSLRNVHVFNGTGYGAVLWGTVGLEWIGGGAYQGFGSTQTVIVGGPHSTRNRIDANVGNLVAYPGSLR